MKANPTYCTSGRLYGGKACGKVLQEVWYGVARKRESRAAMLCPRCDRPALKQAALRNGIR